MSSNAVREPAGAPSLGPRELRAVSERNDYRVDVQSDHYAWIHDESVDKGGTDTGPTPVQGFLGALVSCFTVSFQFAARRKGIPIDRIEGWIVANEQKYIEEVALELQVWSPAPEEDVRALLERAERGCFVRNVMKPEIRFTVDLVVAGPLES